MQTPSRRSTAAEQQNVMDVSVPTGMQRPSRLGEKLLALIESQKGFSPDRDAKAVATIDTLNPEYNIARFQSRPGCRGRRDVSILLPSQLHCGFQSRPGCRGHRDCVFLFEPLGFFDVSVPTGMQTPSRRP